MSGLAHSAAAEPRGQQPRAASRLDFLHEVFAGAEVGQVAFWRLTDRRARWLPVHRLNEAAEIPTTTDIYLTVALHDQELALRLADQTDPSLARGSIGSAIALPGLWADVDVHGPAHKRQDLPRTLDEAHALVEAFPLKPAVVVNSGNGLQVWWLFKEVWTFDGPDDHARAQWLARRFHGTLQAHAAERGWSIDDTSDLARVLRLPDTFNGKLGARVPVRIIRWQPDNRHEPSEFEPYLIAPEASTLDQRIRPPVEWRELTAQGVAEGNRNQSIASLAGHLLRRGIDPYVTLNLLVAWNAARCRPPLPEAEVVRTVDSIAGRELRRREGHA